jgi:hypothetical protein
MLILTKDGLGYILGNMLMNSFGHPGVLLNRNELQKKVAS